MFEYQRNTKTNLCVLSIEILCFNTWRLCGKRKITGVLNIFSFRKWI